MKKLAPLKKIGKLSLLTSLFVFHASGYCENTVDIYGILNIGMNYSNHPFNGNKNLTVGDGPLTGSRLGFRGKEKIADDLSATFVLEQGLNLSNGQLGQGGRAFGRQAYVGLISNQFGAVTLGRQITLGAEMIGATDIFGTANTPELAGTQLALTGLRWDNSLKYSIQKDKFKFSAMTSIANNAALPKSSSAYGTLLSYTDKPLELYGFYQNVENTQDGVPGTKNGMNLDIYGVGVNYQFTDIKLLLSYFNSDLDLIKQNNKTIHLGAIYNLNSNMRVKGSVSYEKQHNLFSQDGSRQTYAAVFSYLLSKRTELYAEADYNVLGGKYTNAVFPFNNASDPSKNHLNTSIGILHRF